jgi:hypothetical protein
MAVFGIDIRVAAERQYRSHTLNSGDPSLLET